MLTHFAELSGCKGAQAVADLYRREPKTKLYNILADLTGVDYQSAKTIYLGLSYGMGGAKLCRSLGLDTKWIRAKRGPRAGQMIEVAGDEGDALFQNFHKEAPFIRQLSEKCEAAAKRRGWVRTVLGRKLHFEKDERGQFDRCHLGLNKLVQGSSADQTKKAMVDIDAAGYAIQLQVHDEINFSGDERDAKVVSDIMVDCVPLQVPSWVGGGIGPNWGAAK